jgi:hypothetical protein
MHSVIMSPATHSIVIAGEKFEFGFDLRSSIDFYIYILQASLFNFANIIEKHFLIFLKRALTRLWYTGERCFVCDPPGYRRRSTTEELLEAVFSARSFLRLCNKDQLPLRESLEMAVRRVGCSCEISARLRGHEPSAEENSVVGRS